MIVRQAQVAQLPKRLPTPSDPTPDRNTSSPLSGVPGLVLQGGAVLQPQEVLDKLDASALGQLKSLAGQALAAAHPLAGDGWSTVWLVVGTKDLLERWSDAEGMGDAGLWLDTAVTVLKATDLVGKHMPAAQPYLPAIKTLGLLATSTSGAYRAVVELDRQDAARLGNLVRPALPAAQKA